MKECEIVKSSAMDKEFDYCRIHKVEATECYKRWAIYKSLPNGNYKKIHEVSTNSPIVKESLTYVPIEITIKNEKDFKVGDKVKVKRGVSAASIKYDSTVQTIKSLHKDYVLIEAPSPQATWISELEHV